MPKNSAIIFTADTVLDPWFDDINVTRDYISFSNIEQGYIPANQTYKVTHLNLLSLDFRSPQCSFSFFVTTSKTSSKIESYGLIPFEQDKCILVYDNYSLIHLESSVEGSAFVLQLTGIPRESPVLPHSRCPDAANTIFDPQNGYYKNANYPGWTSFNSVNRGAVSSFQNATIFGVSEPNTSVSCNYNLVGKDTMSMYYGGVDKLVVNYNKSTFISRQGSDLKCNSDINSCYFDFNNN